jgi:hypothetical protein
MQARRGRQTDVVIAFPTQHARRRPIPEICASVSASRHPSTVVPLRCGHAAERALILVAVRRLHAEIEALTSLRNLQRNKVLRTQLAPRRASLSALGSDNAEGMKVQDFGKPCPISVG